MVNLSKWLAELLFTFIHVSFNSAEPPFKILNQKLGHIIQAAVTPHPPPPPPPQPPTRHPPPPTISIFTLKPDTPAPPICKIEKMEWGKYLSADCSNKKLSKIPQDFGVNYPNIKTLDLSNNPITHLNNSDLHKFASLTELAMRNIPNLNSFPKDFFSHSIFLEKLDISGTPISDFGEINIYLHILNATNIQAKDVNLSHLISLEELHLKDNPQLANFPLLSLVAPLNHLDVRFCSMINLTYANLAPFCLLKYFGLESVEIEKAPNATQCCFIKNWTMFFQIPGSENQKCGPGDPCSKINSTLSLDVVAVRNECLSRTGFIRFLIVLAEILVGVVVASGVLYFLCYNYIFKRKKKDTYEYYDDTPYYDTDADYDYAYDDDDDDGGDDEEEYQYYY